MIKIIHFVLGLALASLGAVQAASSARKPPKETKKEERMSKSKESKEEKAVSKETIRQEKPVLTVEHKAPKSVTVQLKVVVATEETKTTTTTTKIDPATKEKTVKENTKSQKATAVDACAGISTDKEDKAEINCSVL